MTILPGLALLKPTQQSSTYRFYTAGYAVDGINGTDMAVDKCSSTDGGDTNPWWMVDLHTVYSITSVKIFNRGLEQGGIRKLITNFDSQYFKFLQRTVHCKRP